jgi:Fe-S cluster assembly ATP-binding protein
MLKIDNLHVSVEGNEILKGINLEVKAGEVHAIMGPNGSGKSTLSQTIAGHEAYQISEGSITYEGKDLLEMPADVRACEGIYMAFQYPVEIPGITNSYFLKAALNSVRKYRGQEELDAIEFLELIDNKIRLVELPRELLKRSVNEGFSGGEKKRNEIFHMAVLEPKLAILDETDSGLDIDALRIVAEGVNKLRNENRAIIVITHYERILNYLTPEHVHILSDGKIVKSGGFDLAKKVEHEGYDWLKEENGAAATVGA